MRIDDEQALANFIRQQIDGSQQAALVSQLQGTLQGAYIHGEYIVGIGGLAANSVNFYDVITTRPLGSAWLPVGSTFYVAGADAWTEQVRWSYTGVNANTFRVKVATAGGSPGVGAAILFWVISRA